jgi:hypothetical protein
MNMWEKCAWCGNYNPNITLDINGNIVEVRPCNKCNQPERLNKKTSEEDAIV